MRKNLKQIFSQREMKEGIYLPLYDDIQRKYGFCIYNINISDDDRDDFKTAPVRRYDFWCLSHVFAGRGACCLEGKGYFDLEPGTAVLVAPGERNLLGGTPIRGYREDFIAFGGPLFENMHNMGILESGCCYIGTTRRLPLLKELLKTSLPDSYWRCCLRLQEILMDMHSRLHDPDADSPIARLLKDIQNAPERWWNLEELAAACHRSPAQTRRLFLHYTGMTPKDYVEKIKFNRAKDLLCNSSYSIDDIARDLGFLNRYHFSRRFKAIIGLPPAHFRYSNPT